MKHHLNWHVPNYGLYLDQFEFVQNRVPHVLDGSGPFLSYVPRAILVSQWISAALERVPEASLTYKIECNIPNCSTTSKWILITFA